MDHEYDDEAPPPYSAIDPLQQASSNDNITPAAADESRRATSEPQPFDSVTTTTTTTTSSDAHELETSFSAVRLNDSEPPASSITPPATTAASPSPQPESSSARQPAHFASATGYFAERGQSQSHSGDEKRDTLVHHLTIYARSQGKDFPRRPRCWNTRAADINQHDWDTFLNFAFPAHLGPAASSTRLHRRVRAEIERDRKDRPQETDDERCARLDAVINEWNEYFFNPRGTYVTWVYIADLETGPVSPLCPNCYPQATEASQSRLTPVRTPSFDAPIPVSTEFPPYTIPRRPVPLAKSPTTFVQQNRHSTVAVSPTSAAGITVSPGPGHTNQVSIARVYPYSPYQSMNSWASNPISWANQMSMRAQQYAEKISAQAQEYGRSIEESALQRSRQIEQYSKRLENNALAHGRRIEEAALYQGRKIEQAGDRIGHWATGMTRNSSSSQSPREQTDDWDSRSVNHVNLQQPSARRSSTASNASSIGSNDSLSSIDTISTTAELEPDDLAAVRAQLISLDDYHHHELHSAAVGLRGHLRVLQQTRRDSRFLLPRIGTSIPQRGSWGRWDSPQDEKQREERRVAIREEAKLLRQTFRETDRRAKRELRDLQRIRRTRKLQRQQRPPPPVNTNTASLVNVAPSPIDRSISNFEDRIDKEVLTSSPISPTSLNRTVSEPMPVETRPAPPPAPAPAVNPHEAAKAWANAQRAKAKDIQKANKQKIKEIQKSYKEHEKKQKKLAKKQGKQTTGIAAGLTRQITPEAASSVSLTSTTSLQSTGNVSNPPLPRPTYPQPVQESSPTHVRPDAGTGVSWGAGMRQESGVSVTVPDPEPHTFELEGDYTLGER